MDGRKLPSRKDGRIIIHFDYDCFYASVFEAKNPALKSLPFAVQQKQIIVTCNYEARRRGLHKLQLIRDAKRICPEVIIELGEDISRFRDASKELFYFLKHFSWNGKVERLGFDEIWMDVTDIVDYNVDLLNGNNLHCSFFLISRSDPTEGFSFDATGICGNSFPHDYQDVAPRDELVMRLKLGSHFALYLRHQLEHHKGYTSTVGVSTNKTLSKLVGNLNKPESQTTLMPPLTADDDGHSNVLSFMDSHDIGKVPGIGFKSAQKLREHYLKRPADFEHGLIYGGTKEKVSVADIRTDETTSPDSLESVLGGPGSPHGIGSKVWFLIHGIDDTEVSAVKIVPGQISIEDSYVRLDTLPEVMKELMILSKSLITRMRVDLLVADEDAGESGEDGVSILNNAPKWLAHPKTLRLTTRPRSPLLPDGTRMRSFKRISHSAPLPSFVFNIGATVDALADKLVHEALLAMFHRLHPEKSGWNLSLVNVAVTNMAETAGNSKTAKGRDIGNMFRKQEDMLKDFRVTEKSPEVKAGETGMLSASYCSNPDDSHGDSDDNRPKGFAAMHSTEDQPGWGEDETEEMGGEPCCKCGMRLPPFAMLAHERFHKQAQTQ
ncbi:DNA/RNA polymerase [Polychaeton citri CBS 116435]|uniref:DNA/RNA polymerase n=1 Tax=Polychaeton citri CBS 116435 TaxID=1314669 RepID=A0A9P4QEB0_9PEZI|nr:DNA/RNA polymerase [Polychaeton citri CBS 116435]